MAPSPTATAQRPATTGIGFNLAAIAVVLAIGGLAFAYALDSAGRHYRSEQSVTGDVTRTIAGKEITIPRSLLRYDEQAASGFTEQIELRLRLPLGNEGAIRPVDVTLVPRSKARPSSTLLDGVYLHQFGAAELSGPPGLIGKPLKGNDGFENETVWYDALSPNPFVAKCQAAVAENGPGRCLRTVFFDTVAAIYAFDTDLLDSWRTFDGAAETVLADIGVKRTK